ncbi:pirin family protein [Microbacterium sp. C7(2022)]|uniref:pirin family protein n=1 Tax=Microbacterium sp. C7(2022) TaxID=2992759 RepID=UPI00237A956F|nr:pirin family protein [Microbacterium sp. C7(2022)]MDE0545126.1 pirin family protein [Microbacterium sp. C7(2022)]
MTRLDSDDAVTREAPAECDGPRALVFEAREVPLGGVRAMEVRRALPQRELPLVGAWCFLDRFGPQVTTMRVEPHPHIGLQTVTWPLVGEVRHRDSIASDVVVRRGALNLMTSGAGISHSEYSVPDSAAGNTDTPLDALQLWIALPESRRHGAPAFEQHDDLPMIALEALEGAPGEATVVLGTLAGISSPATVYTPIVGAEIRLPAGAVVRVPLDPDWEHAIAGVTGSVVIDPGSSSEAEANPQRMVYLGIRRTEVLLRSDTDATVFLLGGEPFEDDIVMWWNFVARSHDEIVAAREAWEAASDRFGVVNGHDVRIPAPPMPGVRLTRRRRRI